MNIFLTGATGFIGGSIAKALLRAGHTVTALVLDIHVSGAKARHLLGWVPQAPSVLDDLIHGSYSGTSIDRA